MTRGERALSGHEKRFRARIRDVRKLRGLSQHQVSAMAGLHRSAYSAIESGTRRPRLDEAIRIAEALDVSVEDLCGEEPVTITTKVVIP